MNLHRIQRSRPRRAADRRCAPSVNAAFTLLEVLLSVAVFAVVLAAITSVYFSALRLRNRATAALDHALPVQQALGIIRADLSALRPPGTGLTGAFQTVPTQTGSIVDSIGRRISPNLHTRTGQIDENTPFSEMQRVAYFLANPTNGAAGFELMRTVTRNLLPVNVEEFETQFLLGGVDSALMLFHDGNTWLETWDSTISSNLPVAIRFQITLLPPNQTSEETTLRLNQSQRTPIELVVPLSPFGNTNTAAATTTGGAA